MKKPILVHHHKNCCVGEHPDGTAFCITCGIEIYYMKKEPIKIKREDIQNMQYTVNIDLENTLPIPKECDCWRCESERLYYGVS